MSVRAIAGELVFILVLFCPFPLFPQFCQRPLCRIFESVTFHRWGFGCWREDALDWRGSEETEVFARSGGISPGDGGFPRSIDAGPHAEGGGFLRSTVTALVSEKERLSQFLLRRLLDYGERRLTKFLDAVWKP